VGTAPSVLGPRPRGGGNTLGLRLREGRKRLSPQERSDVGGKVPQPKAGVGGWFPPRDIATAAAAFGLETRDHLRWWERPPPSLRDTSPNAQPCGFAGGGNGSPYGLATTEAAFLPRTED
jgi:hypothetical protein